MAAKETPAASEEKMSINRREFLNFAWLASLGFMAVSLGGMTYFFAMPRFKEGEFGGIVTFPASEIPPSSSAPANKPEVKIWLSNTDQGVMALYKVCTHLGCLYNWRENEDKFVCPCHGSQFQKNGTYIQGPAPRSLDRFSTKFVDAATGQVISESSDGGPLATPDNPNAILEVDTGNRIPGQPKG